MRCTAETKRGDRCKNPARPDSTYCRVHRALESNGEIQATHVRPTGAGAKTKRPAKLARPAVETSADAKRKRPAKSAEPQPPAEINASNPAEDDPFRVIAEAMSQAASEMERAEDPVAPSDQRRSREQYGSLAKAVYSTSYGLGYGVILPTLLTLGLLPMDNSAGRGLRDGARAAIDSVQSIRSTRKPKTAAKKAGEVSNPSDRS